MPGPRQSCLHTARGCERPACAYELPGAGFSPCPSSSLFPACALQCPLGMGMEVVPDISCPTPNLVPPLRVPRRWPQPGRPPGERGAPVRLVNRRDQSPELPLHPDAFSGPCLCFSTKPQCRRNSSNPSESESDENPACGRRLPHAGECLRLRPGVSASDRWSFLLTVICTHAKWERGSN